MRLVRFFILAAIVLAVGAAAFLIARAVTDQAGTQAQQPVPPTISPQDIRAKIDAEAARPRFIGELLGVFIAPTEADWPRGLREENARLVAGGCEAVPFNQAGALDLPREPVLPGSYGQGTSGPEVVACSGVVTGVNREYTGTSASGFPVQILVARSTARAWDFSAATDKVSTATIGGREAIVIRPATPDGTGQRSQVLFPEPFGVTLVHAFDLSEQELMAVAEAVAAATR